MTDEILIHKHGRVGHISLNRPKALHALTLDMCHAMSAALTEWADDDSVEAVILDHADVVVAHGGYGSLTGALKRGLPVLSLPLAPPDNRFNAAQLVKLGAGLALGEDARPPEAIRRSLRRLLDHRQYRDRASEIADEIAALPPIDDAAELLERLAQPAD